MGFTPINHFGLGLTLIPLYLYNLKIKDDLMLLYQ